MSIGTFIPAIWSETLLNELSTKYIGVANCNRAYEGDIKNVGNVVKICGINPISTFDYSKNHDIPEPELLTGSVTTLSITKAVAFNIAIDDIDKAQTLPNVMQGAMRCAADALANDADKFVYGLYYKVPDERRIENSAVTPENIIDTVIRGRELLYEGNVTNTSDIVLEVSPAIASIILKSKLIYGSSDNANTLSCGYIGSFCGCPVYVSNNIARNEETGIYHCYMRTRRAIAFVDQFSEICAYRPENRFADALKGLHLYGGNLIYPKEIALLELLPA